MLPPSKCWLPRDGCGRRRAIGFELRFYVIDNSIHFRGMQDRILVPVLLHRRSARIRTVEILPHVPTIVTYFGCTRMLLDVHGRDRLSDPYRASARDRNREAYSSHFPEGRRPQGCRTMVKFCDCTPNAKHAAHARVFREASILEPTFLGEALLSRQRPEAAQSA